MTIVGWIVFAAIAFCLILGAICGAVVCENIAAKITISIVCALATIGLLIGMLWYFGNTASGQRAMVDQQSDLGNGLNRIVRVYTANGDIIAEFEGKIDFRGFHPCDGPDTIVVDGEKVKGRWVEGYFFQIWERTYILWGTTNDVPNMIEVLSSTVGQYTGLDDSDGRKVFEGDILRFTDEPNDYEWTGRIEFGNPNGGYTWGFQIVHMSGPEPNIDTLCWFDMEEGGAYSRVIGTVFDVDESID